jgi:diguanylate cyclase (GGDEF)-like protein
MIDNETTLLERLNNIVDEVHVDEVKIIINTLSKINQLKLTIEEHLFSEEFFTLIDNELKKEFGITNLKIIYISEKEKTLLYKSGDALDYNYTFKNSLTHNASTFINISIDNKNFSNYQMISLNSYFKELIHLIYIQFVLSDLHKSSGIDPLTKLQTRISFNQEMKTLVPLAIREKMKFGVLLINIDRFRAVNDEHGDEFGDDFLKLYATRIKKIIRTSDIAVRFAGGEFLVLLINVESEEMTMKIAEKIRDKLAEIYLLSPNDDKFKKTVSIGIAMFPDDSSDINDVIKFSERALGDAQDMGRNRVLRYDNSSAGEIDFF